VNRLPLPKGNGNALRTTPYLIFEPSFLKKADISAFFYWVMRVVLLTHGGAELVIDELAKIASVEIAGVFIEQKTTPERSMSDKLRRSIRYDGYFATAKKFLVRSNGNESSGSKDLTVEACERNGIKYYFVDDYHSAASRALLTSMNADLGVVYGTNIIKESVFSIPRLGSINLHQGLAPLYRGGPPVFWELFNGEKEVGLTVHFVAAKVDTGDIILQETVPLEYDGRFGTDFERFTDEFRAGLRAKCAELVAKAVTQIASGEVKTIKQDISLGKRYRLPVKKEKDEMRRRLRMRLENA
jgi:folate-dependent phosphoribosylglycinamide formyltransferase PurN